MNYAPISNNNSRQSSSRYSTAPKNRPMYNRNTSSGYNGSRQNKPSEHTRPTQRSNACFDCGRLELYIDIGDRPTMIKGYVVKELCSERILGMNFISKYQFIINVEEHTVTLRDDDKCITATLEVNQCKIHYSTRTTRYTHTVVSNSKLELQYHC
ncbi:unnamed protein product [Adineta ricciae]|uniref:Uncharacterized protein n=1 Tax=Adineta ricciae TaxID=249248 RepID=A0A816EV68_ADIRI|nr:unnamed protein product [Adineta ricciae]CAF1654368.1 unnamed protein product [Adineta ricciae]